ncbi:MAG: nicotinate-nucleotide--dimethylbenzimidazole phosphoribosyltransferase [Eggerthellaceae bacterium]|nr:nicotinate-nucleotide--dimethylbenzimidazole phosphoribosyltransferase [Eggerthellaceae bacterium]
MSFDLDFVKPAPPDGAALAAARAKWNAVAKPIGSLGELEAMVEKIAGLTGDADVDLSKRAVVVLCADNGVVARGVSQSGPDVTTAVASNIARNVSSVCMMASASRLDAYAVDMGMLDPPDDERVIDRSMGRGTADITTGPAMSREIALAAVRTGIDLVSEFKEQGYRILATGEMGIGNTTTSSAMAAAFLGMSPTEVTGRGAGLSDEGLARKVEAVERALEVNAPDSGDPLGVLASLGGFDIAGLAGMFIGGAVHRVPIVIDGFISALAAYTAARLCPGCECAMLASHVSAEPAARMLLEALGLHAPIQAGLRLGEGTGAVLLLPMLDAALALYNGTTFDETGIEAYEVHPR